MPSKKIHIIGAGPAGMFAAYCLQSQGFEVHLFDQKPALARKFLVAGHNGLNLTNAKPLKDFVYQYPDEAIRKAVNEFTPDDLRYFFEILGVETFIGSSGKVYPIPSFKPIEVLEIWRNKLLSLGVKIYTNYTLKNVSENTCEFMVDQENIFLSTEIVLFALGGASWKSTGADGTWTKHFAPYLDLIPFSASNAGFVLSNWKNLNALAGLPVKNITLQMGEKIQKGEFVISEQGIEGGPVYAMNHLFRKGINTMYIDFKPDLKIETIYSKLIQAKNTTEALKELRLSKGSIGMIKTLIDKDTFTDSKKMSLLLKSFPLQIENLYAIDKAISTVGGIPLNALDDHFKCIAHPNWYFIGEMVDWDAPTGGYLLQACFSMAYVASKNIVQNTSIES